MNIQEAVAVLDKLKSESKPRKFKESIDLAINFKDLDLRNPSNRFTLQLVLPNPPDKDVKICVVTEGQQAMDAEKEENVTVLSIAEIEQIAKDKKEIRKLANEHDFFLVQAPFMVKVVKALRRFLDPRGKMPAPLPPAAPVSPIIDRLRKTVRIRVRKSPTVHVRVGTRDMESEAIAKNIQVITEAVENKLERGAQNIKSIYVKSTMGPAYRLV